MSATDWLNSQCTDRLISAVLIGPSLAQVATSYRPTNTTESHQGPHHSYKEPFTTYTHTYNTLYNVHAQQSTLGNTRSPVTSRPLNGHFAIILFPLTHWRSRLAFFQSLLHLLIVILSTFIHHPGRFLGPPPGYTAWLWGAQARCPVGGPELSAQGRLFLYMSL